MDIQLGTFTKSDGTARQQIRISSSPDWALFDSIASMLPGALGGQWCRKLDGLDQRYWDLQRDSGGITMHLEHYLGINAYSAGGASSASATLLIDAYRVLADFSPPDST